MEKEISTANDNQSAEIIDLIYVDSTLDFNEKTIAMSLYKLMADISPRVAITRKFSFKKKKV